MMIINNKSRPLVEAQEAILTEVLDAIKRPCQFAVGQFVVARSNAPLNFRGPDCPYIVVEVISPVTRWEFGGMQPDMRLAFVDNDGDVFLTWGESWMFEPRDERSLP